MKKNRKTDSIET